MHLSDNGRAAMQQTRKKLSLRANAASESVDPADALPALFRVSIARKTHVTVTYNRVAMLMAPYILYTRHGDLFIDAVVHEKDGKVPKELKLGTFKLAGLSDVTATFQPFEPLSLYDPADAKYVGTTVCSI